jgi:hypothetical protein
MNIMVRYCGRESKCSYCPEVVKAGEPILELQQWGNKKGSTKRWMYSKRFHPQCWLDHQLQELKKEPYIGRIGRTPNGLSEEDKKKRNSIMMRRASVVQRIRKEMGKPDEDRKYDKIVHLGEMLEKIKIEIEQIGGVPKKW